MDDASMEELETAAAILRRAWGGEDQKFAFDFAEVILHSHLDRAYVDRVLTRLARWRINQ